MDNKNFSIDDIVDKWLHIASRDLLTAKQGLNADPVVTDTVCFHCQQAAEKYLKAYLVKYQVDFKKIHSIMPLINLCSTIDSSFKEKLSYADELTDYAVELRYPDDWYEPEMEEALKALEIAENVKDFVLSMLNK